MSKYDIKVKVLYEAERWRKFELLEPVHFHHFGLDIIVPEGFRFDGRSSPGFLKGLFPTFGRGALAWLLHDYLYVIDYGVAEYGWSKKQARRFADDIMFKYSEFLNPTQPILNRLSFYYVRAFGWIIY